MTLFQLILGLLALAVLGFIAVSMRRRDYIIAANALRASTHAGGSISRFADQAIGRYILVKQGDSDTDVDICGATDRPIAVTTDEVATADIASNPVNVLIPPTLESTIRCTAGGNINVGDQLYTTAAGEVLATPVPGCYHVGIALSDAADGEEVAVAPQRFGEPFVYRGKITLGGGGATEAIAITGLLAAHHVSVTIANNNGNEDLNLLEATPSADTLTVRFQEDPGDGAIIDVTIAAATTTADNGA